MKLGTLDSSLGCSEVLRTENIHRTCAIIMHTIGSVSDKVNLFAHLCEHPNHIFLNAFTEHALLAFHPVMHHFEVTE